MYAQQLHDPPQTMPLVVPMQFQQHAVPQAIAARSSSIEPASSRVAHSMDAPPGSAVALRVVASQSRRQRHHQLFLPPSSSRPGRFVEVYGTSAPSSSSGGYCTPSAGGGQTPSAGGGWQTPPPAPLPMQGGGLSSPTLPQRPGAPVQVLGGSGWVGQAGLPPPSLGLGPGASDAWGSGNGFAPSPLPLGVSPRRAGSRGPGLSAGMPPGAPMPQVTPRAGGMTPRVPFGTPGLMLQAPPPEVQVPARAFSAPRAQGHSVSFSADAPAGMGLQVPLQPFALGGGPGLQVGFGDAANGPPSQAATPAAPLPVGLFVPSAGQLLQDSVEGKIRQWLRTIPIGNGADRGWDDAQIAEIAEFAQDQHLEHLGAEDIYKRFVEHQVERAEEA